MSTSLNQRWLLPRQQTEYPTKDLIAEDRLHGRREGTFLALAAMFLVASAALLLLGASRVIDLSSVVAAVVPGAELPIEMALPLGVVPFVLGFIAIALVCDLFGRRRATLLVWTGIVASLALVGLAALTDQIDGTSASVGSTLALASCFLTANVAFVVGYDLLRRKLRGRHMWLRLGLATAIAQAIGFGTFALAVIGLGLASPDEAIALAVGSAAYVTAAVIALTLPAVLVARAFTVYLRVNRHEADDDEAYIDGPMLAPVRRRLPQATIVEEEADEPAEEAVPLRRRAARASIQPYSSAEMRFFTEGDQLAEPEAG